MDFASDASQHPHGVGGESAVGGEANVGFLNGGVAAHRPHLEAALADRELDHLAGQVVDQLRTEAARQLADRGLVGDLGHDRDPAEPTQMERVGHLPDQPLVPPAVTMLQRHQAHVGGHRDAGPADVEVGATPVLLELPQHGWSIEHLVQPGQIIGEGAHELGEELVPDGLDLAGLPREHDAAS